MKLTETTLTLAFIAFGTASFAGIFDLPAHQQDGFRDTGCDEAARVEILNDAGELLYTNNASCPDVGGAGLSEFFMPTPEAEEGDDVAEPVEPVPPVKPKA